MAWIAWSLGLFILGNLLWIWGLIIEGLSPNGKEANLKAGRWVGVTILALAASGLLWLAGLNLMRVCTSLGLIIGFSLSSFYVLAGFFSDNHSERSEIFSFPFNWLQVFAGYIGLWLVFSTGISVLLEPETLSHWFWTGAYIFSVHTYLFWILNPIEVIYESNWFGVNTLQ